jgi:restriction system protein
MKYDFEDLHDIFEREEYTRSYDTRYIAEIKHNGLGTFRVLKDMNSYLLDMKVEDQFRKWDEQWAKIVEKNKLQADKEASLNLAEEQTLEAQNQQIAIENILIHTLSIDDAIDWETLKDKRQFTIPNPKNDLKKELDMIKNPNPPILIPLPSEPTRESYKPKLSIFDKLVKSVAQKKIELAEIQYQLAVEDWKNKIIDIKQQNERINTNYQEALKEVEFKKNEICIKYDKLEIAWGKSIDVFYDAQNEHNSKVDLLKSSYLDCNTESVIEYCELVLNNSQYPDFLPKNFDVDYNKESKMLIVEYVLPSPEMFPTLTEVKYIATKKELKEIHLSENQIAKIYDNAIYNITLRTIHELFEADKVNAFDIVVFNGWVEAINKATGKKVNNCIVSIQSKKEEFIEIDLSQVDPKACFKNLKGIGSSKLSGITAVKPIIQINKNDKRFVSSYDVASQLNEGSNLASMEWEDFEHLIREIFEKEFSTNGGEVKVTQASRDGGVDAVAFDPDPIRGGKIVIQAKRYTNTVGVSAVRDLYGTVMNEGATKGILVTTADYGPDAYEFAKNKPLTLMNGANLLYLLEKHGHKARIDIVEAKK